MPEQVVVSAAIVDEKSRRVLLAQRSGDTSHGWLWCTPGGKVEAGETHREALARELREELGVDMRGAMRGTLYERQVISVRNGKPVLVVCYVVSADALEGKPQCGDATTGLGWFGRDIIGALPMAPADSAERDRFFALLAYGTF